MFATHPVPLDFLSITGPRRHFLRDSSLNPYYATPFGDMMLAGSYGMVRALAAVKPEWTEPIDRAMRGQGRFAKSLW